MKRNERNEKYIENEKRRERMKLKMKNEKISKSIMRK